MATQIKVRRSPITDIGLDIDQYLADRGYSTDTRVKNGAFFDITLFEDLTDLQKSTLQAELALDLSAVETQVSDAGETVVVTQRRYMRVVDRCSEERIRRGFMFQAKLFGLSLFEQMRANRYYTVRAVLPYPFVIPTADNFDGVNINDQAELVSYLQTLGQATFTIEQEGITEKINIKNAVSKAAARTSIEAFLTANACTHLIPNLGL